MSQMLEGDYDSPFFPGEAFLPKKKGKPMSQSPAAYLRALDQAATSRPWGFEVCNDNVMGVICFEDTPDVSRWVVLRDKGNAQTAVALRNLLPELAAVVGEVDEVLGATGLVGVSEQEQQIALNRLRVARDIPAAAIAREQAR